MRRREREHERDNFLSPPSLTGQALLFRFKCVSLKSGQCADAACPNKKLREASGHLGRRRRKGALKSARRGFPA